MLTVVRRLSDLVGFYCNLLFSCDADMISRKVVW